MRKAADNVRSNPETVADGIVNPVDIIVIIAGRGYPRRIIAPAYIYMAVSCDRSVKVCGQGYIGTG
jgi:hypothetical protein